MTILPYPRPPKKHNRRCAACSRPARTIYCPACANAYPALTRLLAEWRAA